jgi:hypothetical protein
MKSGAENRNKTIIAGALIAAAVITVIYVVFTQILPMYSSAPRPTPPPSSSSTSTEPSAASTEPAPGTSEPSASTRRNSSNANASSEPAAAGVPATRLATTSSSLDPTLDQAAMLRTESLVYSGSGRNIFSSSYTAELAIPSATAHVRHHPTPPVYVPPTTPPPPPTCPPSCPPINLKFFGTATRSNGLRQAFLLSGEDVYLASVGDIVARKYKIISIGTSNIQVEDLQNKNTQTLPLVK